MGITEEQIAELTRLDAEAVPAPWSAGGDAADESHIYAPGGGDEIPYEKDDWLGVIMAKFAIDPHVGWTREWRHGLDIASGKLTAAMRNVLPELLAERAADKARIAELEAENKKERGYVNRADNLILEVQKRNKELKDALQSLYDEQNGPPILSHGPHEKRWKAAMQKAGDILSKTG